MPKASNQESTVGPVFLFSFPIALIQGEVVQFSSHFKLWFVYSNRGKASLTSCWGWTAAMPCHAMPWLPHLAFLVSFISTTSQFHTPMSQNSFLWVTLVRFSTNFESAYHSSSLLPWCLLSSSTPCAVSQRVLSIESISHQLYLQTAINKILTVHFC